MELLELLLVTFIYLVNSTPQQDPDITVDLQITNQTETKPSNIYTETNAATNENIFIPDATEKKNQTEVPDNPERVSININDSLQITTKEEASFMTKFYIALKRPIVEFIETPKVNVILKNIGTCIVNGVMEIVSYYFPAPLIPLIASAAGSFIPFEPVMMLRKRMPVTNYRRAFNKAVNSFMGTFDRFKTSEDDPYMTRRFNRRFMQEDATEDKNID